MIWPFHCRSLHRLRCAVGQTAGLFVLAALPCVAIVALTHTYIETQRAPCDVLRMMTHSEQVIQAATNLTRQLQVERALAALKAVHGQDRAAPCRWLEQTARTERCLREYEEALSTAEVDDQCRAAAKAALGRLTEIRRGADDADRWSACLVAYSELIDAVLATSSAVVEVRSDRGIGKVFGKLVLIQTAREAASRLHTLLLVHRLRNEALDGTDVLEVSRLWTLASRFLASPLSGLGAGSKNLHARIRESAEWLNLRLAATAIITHQTPTPGIPSLSTADKRDTVAERIFAIEMEECRQLRASMAQFGREDRARNTAAYSWAAVAVASALAVGVLVWITVLGRRRLASAHAISRQSEARLRAITDSAQDAILMMDPRGRLSYWNPAAERVLGYTSAEALGQDLHQLLVPERYQEQYCQAFPHFQQTGSGAAINRTLELHGRRKDGVEITVALSLSAVQTDGAWHAIGILRDETERKKSEEHLAYQRRKLQRILDILPNGIYLIDQQYNIEYINRYVERELGPVEGQKCYQHLQGQSQPCSWCPAEKVFRGEEVRWETPCFKNNRVYELLNVPLQNEDGKLLNLYVMHDVTAHKQSEEELRGYTVALQSANMALEEFNQIAESATRAKSEFLANMSHEIRTPMTAILGFAEILAESVQEPELQSAARTIQRNGDHLLRLINDILDLSKIEAGKLSVEHVACSPMAVLADVVSLMQVRADAKGLSLRLECPEPMPETVLTDPTRLRQILVNLVGNALKFTETGAVRLIARFLNAETTAPRLCCEIVDSGIGMTAEQIARLFQPFHQGEASTTRRFGGTGLGLAISQRLARLLGGKISVSSTPGKGTTFTVILETSVPPTVAATGKQTAAALPHASPDAPSERPVGLGTRILLAEDGVDNQRLFSRLLRRARAEVTLAENGQRAVDIALTAQAEGKAFDVVLMDMQMPVLDGYEATRRLRAEGLTQPIIALTAHAMAEDRQKCLGAGCNDYLSKPVKQADLLAMVARHTQGLPQDRPEPCRPPCP